ncbi:gliding motility-associated C-terminal domain-containing protein [Flavobacteriaceae bacterium MHTCC 0001]
MFLGNTITLEAQIVINKPITEFTGFACGNSGFNSFNVDITFTGVPEGSNQFIIELSDASGSFSDPTVIFTSTAGSVTTSPAQLNFSLPEDTSGEDYKLRVKTTAPASTSPSSNTFAAYYKIQDSPFTINNLEETAVYCPGGSYLLTIDNPGVGDNDSPLQYPSLSFNWYRETSPTTSVFVASGESLEVSSPGTYFVETNYGTCTSDSFSNRVDVSEASSGSVATSITSSSGNPYCADNGPTTLSATAGNSYTWFKDGVEIQGATGQTYETSEDGVFSVNINIGNCTASASIDLANTGFTSSIDVEDAFLLEDGQTRLVTVTTSAASPQFEWYRNDELITGEDTNTYEVTQGGSYRVEVSQSSAQCTVTKTFSFNANQPFPDVANIPNVISPNNDFNNDTWVIPQAYISGTNTKITIYSSQGKKVFETLEYQNNWPENQQDFNSLTSVFYYIIEPQDQKPLKGSITVLR